MILYSSTVFGGGWLPYALRVAWARGLLGRGYCNYYYCDFFFF